MVVSKLSRHRGESEEREGEGEGDSGCDSECRGVAVANRQSAPNRLLATF
jgi:hypothetical protein